MFSQFRHTLKNYNPEERMEKIVSQLNTTARMISNEVNKRVTPEKSSIRSNIEDESITDRLEARAIVNESIALLRNETTTRGEITAEEEAVDAPSLEDIPKAEEEAQEDEQNNPDSLDAILDGVQEDISPISSNEQVSNSTTGPNAASTVDPFHELRELLTESTTLLSGRITSLVDTVHDMKIERQSGEIETSNSFSAVNQTMRSITERMIQMEKKFDDVYKSIDKLDNPSFGNSMDTSVLLNPPSDPGLPSSLHEIKEETKAEVRVESDEEFTDEGWDTVLNEEAKRRISKFTKKVQREARAKLQEMKDRSTIQSKPAKPVRWADMSSDDDSVGEVPKGYAPSWKKTPGGDDEPSFDPYVSGDEESNTSSDDECCLKAPKFKIEAFQAKQLQLLQAPFTKESFDRWKDKVFLRLRTVQLARYIDDDVSKRPTPPERPHMGTKHKTKAFKKYRCYHLEQKQLLLAIQTISIDHPVYQSLLECSNGTEAWEKIMQVMDPSQLIPVEEQRRVIQEMSDLKLSKIEQGGTTKFLSKLEKLTRQMESFQGRPYDDEFKRANLFGKLTHPDFIPFDTLYSSAPLSYPEILGKLSHFAHKVEHRALLKKNRDGNIRTATTTDKNRDKEKVKFPKEIAGFKVNDNGMVSKDEWKSMSDAQKEKFRNKRTELRDKHKSKQQENPSASSNRAIKKLNKSIDKLLEGEKGTNDSKDSKDSSSKDSNSKDSNEKKTVDISNCTPQSIALINKIIKSKVIKMTRTVTYRGANLNVTRSSEDGSYSVTIDGGADTGMCGKGWIFLDYGLRRINIVGCLPNMTSNNKRIGSAVTAVDLKDSGETIILLACEHIDHTDQATSVLSTFQVRDYGVDLCDVAKHHLVDGRPGRQSMIVDGIEVPFELMEGLMSLKIREPTKEELETCRVIQITNDVPWHPERISDSDLDTSEQDSKDWDTSNSEKTIANALFHSVMLTRMHTKTDMHFVNRLQQDNWNSTLQVGVNDEDADDEEEDSEDDDISSYASMPPLIDAPWSDSDDDDDEDDDMDTDDWVELSDSGDDEPTPAPQSNRERDPVRRNLGLVRRPYGLGNALNIPNFLLETQNANLNLNRTRYSPADLEKAQARLGHIPLDTVTRTLNATTQDARENARLPLRHHLKSRFPLNRPRIREKVDTDTWFSSVTAIGGETCVQLFVFRESEFIKPYGMRSESEGPSRLQDLIREIGAPFHIHNDNSKMQTSEAWRELERTYNISDSTTEPHNPQQNPAERKIKTVKNGILRLMDKTDTPDILWFLCCLYWCGLLNVIALRKLNWRTPTEKAFGITPDISAYLHYEWYEQVYYLDDDGASFPHSREKLARWLGPVEHCGDSLTYYLWKLDTKEIICRSVIRSAASHDRMPNQRALALSFEIDPEAEDVEHEEPTSDETSPDIEGSTTSPSEDKQPAVLSSMNELIDNVTGTKTERALPSVEDLMGYTFVEKKADVAQKVTVVDVDPDTLDATVQYMDGTQAILKYNILVDKFQEEDTEDDPLYTFKDILGHKRKKKKWLVKVDWDGYDPTWEPLSTMRKADPLTLAQYAKDQNLLKTPGWKWAKYVTQNPNKMIRMAKLFKKSRVKENRYKFGVQVANDAKHALYLDKLNGNDLWKHAIEKELNQILDYKTFKILPHGQKAPTDYKRVTLHLTFDVKHDGRRKARLVAGGHLTAPPTEDIFSSVVAPESVRVLVFLAAHNELTLYMADIGNAFLYGLTREKLYAIAGPEFGPELEGRVLIFVQSIYGLRTSAARFHEHCSDVLRDLKYFPSKADTDVWMRDCGDHYEYVATYVDDLIIASKDPQKIVAEIEQYYILKGVGKPDFYLGADFSTIKGPYNEKGETPTWSAKTYLKNVCEKIERLVGPLRSYSHPMDPTYRPELDNTDLLGADDIAKFRMLIGSGQWVISLGRFDVQYPVTMLARFSMAPREGHLKAMMRVFGYLKAYMKGRLIFNTSPLDIGGAEFVEPALWTEMYPNAGEDLPYDMPEPKMKGVDISAYFDASLGCDMLTGRSMTGILLFMNSTPMKWYCKRQNTVETSTYGSELVSGRIATELIMEYRYKLRMLGVPVDGPSVLLGDNLSMVKNCTLPSSQLKKKHNALAYHRVREAVAAKVILLGHCTTDKNLADFLTKALGGKHLYHFLKPLMFPSQSANQGE